MSLQRGTPQSSNSQVPDTQISSCDFVSHFPQIWTWLRVYTHGVFCMGYCKTHWATTLLGRWPLQKSLLLLLRYPKQCEVISAACGMRCLRPDTVVPIQPKARYCSANSTKFTSFFNIRDFGWFSVFYRINNTFRIKKGFLLCINCQWRLLMDCWLPLFWAILMKIGNVYTLTTKSQQWNFAW